MSSNDPFAFLGKTKVTKETVASLEQQMMGEGPKKEEDPFAFLGSKSNAPILVGFKETAPPDIGVVRAFTKGVGEGILEPVAFLRGKTPEDERINSTTEKTAEFLGTMVGLGISFVPIAGGTGWILKGVGFTAGETLASKAAFNFARNVIAGSVQFGGSSEKLEDVPKNLVVGGVFGAAIEGIFLARAIRGRGGKALKNIIDTGSPIPDVPINPNELSLENALSPSDAKTPGRLTQELLEKVMHQRHNTLIAL